MPDRKELLEAIREKREQAARVRRLAQGLSLNADRERLMAQADELEEEATNLARQLANDPAAPPAAPRGMPMQTQQVQQQQVQQQQQHDAEPDKAEPKPTKS